MGRKLGGFWAGGFVWWLGALATGCGDGPALRFEEFYVSNGEERLVGNGCMLAEDGMHGTSTTGVAGGGGDWAPRPYTVEHEGKDGGITVTVLDGSGKVLARRVYDEAFLEAGKSDEIVVDLDTDTLRLHHVGAKSCDPA
jgi:hypothetical protein